MLSQTRSPRVLRDSRDLSRDLSRDHSRVQTFPVRGTVSISQLTVRQRLTHLLAENTLLVVPNTGVTSLVTTGVHQASLVGPALHQSSIEVRGEGALPVVWGGAGGTGAWQAGDGGHDLSQGASL